MTAVLRIKLKCERAFIIDEVRDFGVDNIENQHWLSRRHEIELGWGLFDKTEVSVRGKGTRDGPHELEKGRRHAFLVAMLSLRGCRRLPWTSDPANVVISFFRAVFLLLFLADAIPQEFVPLDFLLLHLNNLLERAYCLFC